MFFWKNASKHLSFEGVLGAKGAGAHAKNGTNPWLERLFRDYFVFSKTELALWGAGACKTGEGSPPARASAPMKIMILADVL